MPSRPCAEPAALRHSEAVNYKSAWLRPQAAEDRRFFGGLEPEDADNTMGSPLGADGNRYQAKKTAAI